MTSFFIFLGGFLVGFLFAIFLTSVDEPDK